MNDLMKQNQSLVPTDPAIAAAAEGAKARIQSAYLMALHRPRNPDQARDRILYACKRPAFAEKVEYNKPVGGKAIKGPSVRFAELALKEWGNVLNDSQVVYEDENVRRVKLFCTDLETNLTHSKEIVINKTVERKKPTPDREILGERTNSQGEKVYIVKATDDEINNKEAALISKALRNEGLRLIPTDIIDEGVETARATLRDRDAKDPASAKKKILDSFSEIGVLPKDIEHYLGHKTDALTPIELQDLRGIYRAIKDGEARWSDYINGDKEKDAGPLDTSAFEELIGQFKIEEEDKGLLDQYLLLLTKPNRMTIDQVKIEVTKDFTHFWEEFSKWRKAKTQSNPIEKKPPEEPPKKYPEKPEPILDKTPPFPDKLPPLNLGGKKMNKSPHKERAVNPLFEQKYSEFVTCPNDGSQQTRADCGNCNMSVGCPALE